MKFESKFYNELKRITPQIRWTRLENSSVFGTPDLLGYNNNWHFFTVELKVTKSNSLRFSPHQIAFHKLHPKNSFILAKHLASSRVKLYEGKKIMELVACGLKLDACCLGLGLEACGLYLSQLGAWSLPLVACIYLNLGIEFFLVFGVCDIVHAPVPACSAVTAFIALVLGRAAFPLRWDAWRPRPPGRILTVYHMAWQPNDQISRNYVWIYKL